jgi:ADP-ribose pyrophosphatase YjhB (NUDIX family)
MSADLTQPQGGWLTPEGIREARDQVPLVYLDAIPVRVDEAGVVQRVGLLLRATADGMFTRTFVSGRVHRGERIRDALMRHLEKDLGPMALPQIPVAPQPFTVVEYFPDPMRSGFHDPRQHAVSLAFIVAVAGDCEPTQQAIDLAWLAPFEAVGTDVMVEMVGGRDRLLRMALAYAGVLP